ncbi:MAG: hypothetical protein JNK05_30180 [Myxococcales bacterium]|nr:hypothetical protein [Myxococcales bacterium]
MSEATTSPRRSKGARMFAVAGLLTLVSGVALVATKAAAHRDWPALQPALAIPAPTIEGSSAAWTAFEQAIAALPPQRGRIGPITEGADTAALAAKLVAYDEAHRRFDAALATGATPAIPPRTPDNTSRNPSMALLELARSRSFRASLEVTNGHAAESFTTGLAIAELGARLAQRSSDWVDVAAAIAIEAQGYRAMERALSANTVTTEVLASAASRLDALLALPSALARANASECVSRESLFGGFRGKSADELLSTTTLERPSESRPGRSIIPASWLFDADATIAAVRHECRRIDEALRRPRGERTIPAPVRYTGESRMTVGQWLDNRVGRVLIDLALPSITNFTDRDDDGYTSRYAARVAVAIAVFRAQNQRLPASLDEARPPAAPQPLGRNRGVTYDAAARALTVRLSPQAPHSSQFVLGWRFAQ